MMACRPTGSFEYEDEKGNTEVNFSAKYYNKNINNISIPRLWLCYSVELQKPYCEVCWLFADRSSPNYENHRQWTNGVLHNMLSKIKRHEASNVHIQATAVYMRWKCGKTVDEENEKETRNNALFWVKVPARATRYLSSQVQNELIELLGKTVTASLVQKINVSSFRAFILDSTSDITRTTDLIVHWI